MSSEFSPTFKGLLTAVGKQATGEGSRPTGFGVDGRQAQREQDEGRHTVTAQLFNEGGHEMTLTPTGEATVCFTVMAKLKVSRFDIETQSLTFQEVW